MSNSGYLTIPEVVQLTGKPQSTIYRYIKAGKINSIKANVNGKTIVKVNINELNAIGYNIGSQARTSEKHLRTSENISNSNKGQYNENHLRTNENINGNKEYENNENHLRTSENQLTREVIKEVIEEFFETKQTQLIKPLEEHALVKYGAINKENEFLKQRLETVLQENEFLREQVKALPDFHKEKEAYKSQVEILEKEKEDLLFRAESIQKEKDEQSRKAEALNQILLDNANNIKELSKEKDNFQSVLKEHEATIKEKERALKDIEELRRQEMEELKKQNEEEKAKLKSEAEEREKQIAEAWKKELEQAKKPWWKFW